MEKYNIPYASILWERSLEWREPRQKISPFFCHEGGRRKQLQEDSYSRQSTLFSFTLLSFGLLKEMNVSLLNETQEFWARYSPYLPTVFPSRLERHNFTLIGDQSSKSLCLEILPLPFVILIFGSLAMVVAQSSSALPDLPTPVTGKNVF